MKRLLAATALILVAGCATAPPPVQLTPLEIQAMQSREFEQPKEIVFQSVMSVFQDLGYTLGSADLQTGFMTATSASKTQQASALEVMLVGNQANQYTVQTRATASVEGLGARTRVRLNFVVGTQASSGFGQQSSQDKPILDAAIYQNAFEKIDTAIFMRAGTKPATPAN